MTKDPAFLFYSSDFTTGTQFFTDEQVGKYIRLLCAQHQHGHLTEKQVLSICFEYDDDIMGKFTIDEEGKYYQKRLELEIAKRSEFTESRRRNASGARESKKDESTSKASGKHMHEHMEDENDNRNIDVINNNTLQENVETTSRARAEILADRFDEFWAAYPRKVAKGKARESWNRIKPSAELHQKILIAVEAAKESRQWKKDNGDFIPNPTTWLNQGRWEDDPPTDRKDTNNPFLKRVKDKERKAP